MPAEAPRKLTVIDRADDFGRKTYEQAEAKKILIRNLKGLIHKVVRISRKNLLQGFTNSDLPLDLAQPGTISMRRFGDTEWIFRDVRYNEGAYGEGFKALVGMVVAYELQERMDGGLVYLIIAAPNDRFEYRFNLGCCELEVLDGFPSTEDE